MAAISNSDFILFFLRNRVSSGLVPSAFSILFGSFFSHCFYFIFFFIIGFHLVPSAFSILFSFFPSLLFLFFLFCALILQNRIVFSFILILNNSHRECGSISCVSFSISVITLFVSDKYSGSFRMLLFSFQ